MFLGSKIWIIVRDTGMPFFFISTLLALLHVSGLLFAFSFLLSLGNAWVKQVNCVGFSCRSADSNWDEVRLSRKGRGKSFSEGEVVCL